MKKISIALCTYNGKSYIREQLESIIKQTVTPYEIIVCDDGSLDGTIDAIEEFSKCAPVPIKLYKNKSQLGIVKNFEKAINYCSGEYIALSDQDDIWKEDKLEQCLNKLQEIEFDINIPVLIHTDLTVVDEKKKIIASSMMCYQGIHHEDNVEEAKRVLLVQNYVTGCTVLFNKALRDKALPFPEKTIMHDWWLALIAIFFGTVGYVNQSTVLYRQHKNNHVGAKGTGWQVLLNKFGSWSSVKKKVHDTVLQSLMIPKDAALNSGWLIRYWEAVNCGNIRRIWSLGIHKQRRVINFIFYIVLWMEYRNELRQI